MIYLDSASTTKISENVYREMVPYLRDEFGNPSSIYNLGQRAKEAIELSRHSVATTLGVNPSTIYFTSGGTESDNMAILGYAFKNPGKHLITSKFEHHGVLNAFKFLERMGYDISYVDILPSGQVDIGDLESKIKDTTGFVSIMYANNEVGTVQDVVKISEICKSKGIVFHSDAVQAVSSIAIKPKGIFDSISISGHKIHGPKGIGILYLDSSVKIESLIHGGVQERNLRAGTENVAFIVGIARAIVDTYTGMKESNRKKEDLKKSFLDVLKGQLDFKINGSGEILPGTINLSFKGVDNSLLLMQLGLMDIYVSAGSACTAGSTEPSHVLTSMGLSEEEVRNSIRVSFDENITINEIETAAHRVIEVVNKLRN